MDVFSPELHLLKSPRNAALFLIFLAASSVTALTAISFIAIRRAGFQFLQSIVVGTRIVFPIPLIALGAIGIFGERGCRPLYPCIRRSLRSVGLFAIKRVQKDVKGLVFGLVVGFGYLFMLMYGVVGVGYAWVVGNGVGCVCVGVMVWGEGWV